MDESFPYELERRLASSWPPGGWCDSHVVLAVSGGADSVVLLRAMVAIKAVCDGAGRLFVAHLNHGLRGEEADADAAWLATLCDRLKVPLETTKAEVAKHAAEQGDGWEAAARHMRYDFLREGAERLGARFVATAHTADDQVETVLHHIVRGTGLAGLAGIHGSRALSKSVALVRPMLSLRRQEIVEYLQAIGQDFRVDSSNDDLAFTRNRLRNELLPLLREDFNADVAGALTRLAAQASEAQHLIQERAAVIVGECVAVEFNGQGSRARQVRIDSGRLAAEPPIIIREVCKAAWRAANWPLQAMGYDEWQLLANMAGVDSPQSTANLPANIRVHRDSSVLIFQALDLP